MLEKPFNKDIIENLLHNFRLTKYETDVYLTLLMHGPQNYKGLLKLSGVPLGKIYYIINSLDLKGWVKSIDEKPRIFYTVNPEEPIKNHLIEIKKQINNLEESSQQIMPQLQNLYDHSHKSLFNNRVRS